MQLLDKLKGLLEPLESYNTASEQLIDNVLKLKIKSSIKTELLSVKKLIIQYDFESAVITVKDLIAKLT